MNYINMTMIREGKSALNLWEGKPLQTIGRMMKSALNGDMSVRAQTYWAILRAAGGVYATSDGYSVYLPADVDVVDILLREDAVRPILTYTDEKGRTESYDLSTVGWRREASDNASFVLFMSTLFTWREDE